MKRTFSIKSKLYVKPKKASFLFKQALTICLIIILIAGIIQIIFDGFSLNILGKMALAAIVISAYNSRSAVKPHYESSIAEICVDSKKLTIEYRQLDNYYKDMIWMIDYAELTALEYSEQLTCLRILGNIKIINKTTQKVFKSVSEHYLYLEKGIEKEILDSVLNARGCPIKCMDQ